jgi:phosphonopyruvate decarboxylase
MIKPASLYDFLQKNGVRFYTGVPDSLLKSFLRYVQEQAGDDEHIITANEGLAMGLAAGHFFGTGSIPLVYLQNSGLGNIINPLTSLADKEVYAVPMILMIGWRGRPGTKDEPQHLKMGRITRSLLGALEIPVYELIENEEKCFSIIEEGIRKALEQKTPVALLTPEGIFDKYEAPEVKSRYTLQREKVIAQIIERCNGDEIIVCTTGKIGREFYEQNNKAGNKISKYFLSVGAMGHANHIALGLKLHSASRVIMLDGDGALLMHMGALPNIARHARNDFMHIIINNGGHESVGGQPTGAFKIDFSMLGESCGYKKTVEIGNGKELKDWLAKPFDESKSCLVEIRTSLVSRNDLGRPSGTPEEWKNNFMKALKG